MSVYKKLNHIAVIVENIEQALIPYEKGLGLKATEIEFVESYNCRVVFIPIGDTQIELIEPLGEEGDLVEFLKGGGGLHHLAIEVDEVEQAINDMEAVGVEMKDKVPKKGAHDATVAFSENQEFAGVTMEFVKPKR